MRMHAVLATFLDQTFWETHRSQCFTILSPHALNAAEGWAELKTDFRNLAIMIIPGNLLG